MVPRKKPLTVPLTLPLILPSTRMGTFVLCSRFTFGMAKDVFAMIVPPRSRICGRTNMTRTIEIMVPRPMASPMPLIVQSVVMILMSSPETARIVPEVRIVGKAKFMASMMASFRSIVLMLSVYRFAITMA